MLLSFFNHPHRVLLMYYIISFSYDSSRPLQLKANKNGVIVIRQTPNSIIGTKKAKPPSAESTRSVNHIRRSHKLENVKQKKSNSKISKDNIKSERLSKAKSFHELNDLTPPRSPILPTTYVVMLHEYHFIL